MEKKIEVYRMRVVRPDMKEELMGPEPVPQRDSKPKVKRNMNISKAKLILIASLLVCTSGMVYFAYENSILKRELQAEKENTASLHVTVDELTKELHSPLTQAAWFSVIEKLNRNIDTDYYFIDEINRFHRGDPLSLLIKVRVTDIYYKSDQHLGKELAQLTTMIRQEYEEYQSLHLPDWDDLDVTLNVEYVPSGAGKQYSFGFPPTASATTETTAQ